MAVGVECEKKITIRRGLTTEQMNAFLNGLMFGGFEIVPATDSKKYTSCIVRQMGTSQSLKTMGAP